MLFRDFILACLHRLVFMWRMRGHLSDSEKLAATNQTGKIGYQPGPDPERSAK